jgi:alpha-amylase
MSDDIAFRFSNREWTEWPLTTEKYVDWLNAIDPREETVNLFMDYETFGEHQWEETGIFEFMKALPAAVFSRTNFGFNTPSELADKLQPVSAVHVPYPISWADEERDLTAWLGNELQDDAFDHIYSLEHKVKQLGNFEVVRDWRYLQTSDHFYYMCTKWFSDGDVHRYFNPYGSPYEAYINFMNVFSDFSQQLDYKLGVGNTAVVEQEKPTQSQADAFIGKTTKPARATVPKKKAAAASEIGLKPSVKVKKEDEARPKAKSKATVKAMSKSKK